MASCKGLKYYSQIAYMIWAKIYWCVSFYCSEYKYILAYG